MAKKNENGYLSAKESRRISRENRKITDQFEKLHKRKNVPEEEFLTKMHDENNSLEIENLHTYFFSDVGTVRAVDGVSFDVPIGKTVGVVGESGCGKSVTSLSIMQLLQRPQGQIVEGEIRLNLGNGKAYDITKTPIEQMQKLRGLAGAVRAVRVDPVAPRAQVHREAVFCGNRPPGPAENVVLFELFIIPAQKTNAFHRS